MAYFAPYIDDAGLHLPTYADIRDDLIAKFKEIYGQDIYLGNDSQDYQMISVLALKTYDTFQLLQLVYNNQSVKTAVGTGLSSRVKLNGLRRKIATCSTCILTLTGMPGTTIPAGIVEDTKRRKWTLPKNVKFDRETIELTATCQDVGGVEAPVGTITKISNPQYGWISVTNRVPAVKGRPIETDEELRRRQTISTAIPSRNMLESTIAGIASVPGVTRYRVYDNDTSETDENGIPSHSIAAVVEGGLDADVARQIYLRKGPGGGTYGSTEHIYVNRDGIEHRIRFFRPAYITVNVKVCLRRNPAYLDTVEALIKGNIDHYLRSLSIGDPVSVTGLLPSITDVIVNKERPEFSLTALLVGRDGNEMKPSDLPIPFHSLATPGTIAVEVT